MHARENASDASSTVGAPWGYRVTSISKHTASCLPSNVSGTTLQHTETDRVRATQMPDV